MRVENLMTQATVTCRPDTTLAEAAKLMWDGDVGFLPTLRDGKLIGVVTDRDICMATAMHRRPACEIAINEVTTGRHFTCAPDDDLSEAMKVMSTRQVRRLPVVDQFGKLHGILSMNDVIQEAKATRGATDSPTYKEVVATMKLIGAHRDLPSAVSA